MGKIGAHQVALSKMLPRSGAAVRIGQRGAQEAVDVRNCVNSLPWDVPLFANSVRGHWGIENTWRWCWDVAFREANSLVPERNLTNDLTSRKRFAFSLLAQVQDDGSVAMRRRCGGNAGSLGQVLFGSESSCALAVTSAGGRCLVVAPSPEKRSGFTPWRRSRFPQTRFAAYFQDACCAHPLIGRAPNSRSFLFPLRRDWP